MLERWLDFHRATLEEKCAGLDDERLRTAAVEPSELTLLGLLRHMAEVERHWFRRVLTGEDTQWIYCDEDDEDRDWHPTDQDTYEEALATWRAEVEDARRRARGRAPDDVAQGRYRGNACNLRWIYVHMIEEYARHNGHADFLRERIDGSTGV
ncbi:DinB family protein [Streptomyces sp. MST-110588]|uniref:DinB family protein n=1 Tax=Streptomyces sp. MST-110588 TaxID=2833628 RepID=UPI001F5DB01D|nr:DinB family protein [Streptomyces sp. MST-110588]UNO43645.1 DinB family protein [Streptomyces sp. MST-110588]